MGDRLGSDFRVRMSEDKVCRKDMLVCEGSLCPRELPDVSGPGLGEAGAQMPPACARARGGSVRGHLGCAVGTGRTDVAQGPLALDARTSHMGRWHWTYGTWPREDVPGLGLTDEDVSLLRG